MESGSGTWGLASSAAAGESGSFIVLPQPASSGHPAAALGFDELQALWRARSPPNARPLLAAEAGAIFRLLEKCLQEAADNPHFFQRLRGGGAVYGCLDVAPLLQSLPALHAACSAEQAVGIVRRLGVDIVQLCSGDEQMGVTELGRAALYGAAGAHAYWQDVDAGSSSTRPWDAHLPLPPLPQPPQPPQQQQQQQPDLPRGRPPLSAVLASFMQQRADCEAALACERLLLEEERSAYREKERAALDRMRALSNKVVAMETAISRASLQLAMAEAEELAADADRAQGALEAATGTQGLLLRHQQRTSGGASASASGGGSSSSSGSGGGGGGGAQPRPSFAQLMEGQQAGGRELSPPPQYPPPQKLLQPQQPPPQPPQPQQPPPPAWKPRSSAGVDGSTHLQRLLEGARSAHAAAGGSLGSSSSSAGGAAPRQQQLLLQPQAAAAAAAAPPRQLPGQAPPRAAAPSATAAAAAAAAAAEAPTSRARQRQLEAAGLQPSWKRKSMVCANFARGGLAACKYRQKCTFAHPCPASAPGSGEPCAKAGCTLDHLSFIPRPAPEEL